MRIFCMALVLGCSIAPALADPTGDWFVEKELSVIRVQPCGQAMCGTIGWTKTPQIDKHNPDPAKRDQPMVGVQILRSMKPAGENRCRIHWLILCISLKFRYNSRPEADMDGSDRDWQGLEYIANHALGGQT